MHRTTDDLLNFDEYVMNDTPIFLTRLSDVALVELDDVRKLFWLAFVQSSWWTAQSAGWAIMQLGNPSDLNWTGEAAKHHSSHVIARSSQSFMGHRDVRLDKELLEISD
ncbi:hypothetical protein BDR06DRAFT_1002820 [Suillus hirtellus]|nr:hypothetical protein BDR06DRAFT_1002820 [Suillus hirtellus]